LRILLGKESFENVLMLLGLQLFWCVALGAASRLFWNRSVKQITVNGG
jgi:ABC-2 type transport system permease protein